MLWAGLNLRAVYNKKKLIVGCRATSTIMSHSMRRQAWWAVASAQLNTVIQPRRLMTLFCSADAATLAVSFRM